MMMTSLTEDEKMGNDKGDDIIVSNLYEEFFNHA